MGLWGAGKYDAENARDIMEHRRKWKLMETLEKRIVKVEHLMESGKLSEANYIELISPLHKALAELEI